MTTPNPNACAYSECGKKVSPFLGPVPNIPGLTINIERLLACRVCKNFFCGDHLIKKPTASGGASYYCIDCYNELIMQAAAQGLLK